MGVGTEPRVFERAPSLYYLSIVAFWLPARNSCCWSSGLCPILSLRCFPSACAPHLDLCSLFRGIVCYFQSSISAALAPPPSIGQSFSYNSSHGRGSLCCVWLDYSTASLNISPVFWDCFSWRSDGGLRKGDTEEGDADEKAPCPLTLLLGDIKYEVIVRMWLSEGIWDPVSQEPNILAAGDGTEEKRMPQSWMWQHIASFSVRQMQHWELGLWN